MFQGFSQDAMQVIVLGQTEVRTLQHNWVGTEHVGTGAPQVVDSPLPLQNLGNAVESIEPRVEPDAPGNRARRPDRR